MGLRLHIRPVDDDQRTVLLESADEGWQDDDGFVDLDDNAASLEVILEALEASLPNGFMDDDHVDAAVVAELASALEPLSFEALFDEGILELDDLDDDPEQLAPYYEDLRELARACADEGAGWFIRLD